MSESTETDLLQDALSCLEHQDVDGFAGRIAAGLGLASDDPGAMHAAGLLCMTWERYAQAEDCFRRLIARHGDSALFANDLGVALFKQGKVWHAREQFRRAQAVDGSFEGAADNLAACAASLEETEYLVGQATVAREGWRLPEAASLLETARRKTMDHPGMGALLAAVNEEMADVAAAHAIRHEAGEWITSWPEMGVRSWSAFELAYRRGGLGIDADPGERLGLSLGTADEGEHAGTQRETQEDEAGFGPVTRLTNIAAFRLGLERAVEGDPLEAALAWRAWLQEGGDWRIRLVRQTGLSWGIHVARGADMSFDEKLALLLFIVWRVGDWNAVLAAAWCLADVYESLGEAGAASALENDLRRWHGGAASRLRQLRHRFPPQGTRGPAESTLLRIGRRRECVLVGTCIVQAVRYFLNCSSEFQRFFNLRTFFTNMDIREARLLDIGDELLESAAAVVHVHPVWADWGNEQAYVDLLARVPAGTHRISIPYPVFQPLWPFHCRDPRNDEDRPDNFRRPMGEQPSYPYGDSLLLGLLRKYGSPEKAANAYLQMDLADQINLDKLLDKTLAIQRDKESATDVKIVDLIEQGFRERRLFLSVNHLANDGLLEMTNQILARLGLPALPRSLLDRTAEIVQPEVPIHPSVIRHFGLTGVREDIRYSVDPYRRLTFGEYVADYVRYV